MKEDGRQANMEVPLGEVEIKFLELFSEGRMNGTFHTCVGQEQFSAP
jgi:TPP-dependent pyruvate/acetoin dehydrogenase alpha subunit